MNSREDILSRIRAQSVEKQKRPAITFQPVAYTQPIDAFTEISETVGSHVIVAKPEDDLNRLISETYPEAKTIASTLPGITCANINPDLPEHPAQLNGTDVAVIRGEFGVIENGAIWIRQDIRHKALYFISEALVILLDRQRLVNNMHEAYSQPGFDDFDYGCFISGPSKTADIEQALVIGAHGAKAVTVILT